MQSLVKKDSKLGSYPKCKQLRVFKPNFKSDSQSLNDFGSSVENGWERGKSGRVDQSGGHYSIFWRDGGLPQYSWGNDAEEHMESRDPGELASVSLGTGQLSGLRLNALPALDTNSLIQWTNGCELPVMCQVSSLRMVPYTGL